MKTFVENFYSGEEKIILSVLIQGFLEQFTEERCHSFSYDAIGSNGKKGTYISIPIKGAVEKNKIIFERNRKKIEKFKSENNLYCECSDKLLNTENFKRTSTYQEIIKERLIMEKQIQDLLKKSMMMSI